MRVRKPYNALKNRVYFMISVFLFVIILPNYILAQTSERRTNCIHFTRNGNMFVVENDANKSIQTIQIETITDSIGTTSFIVTCQQWSQQVSLKQLENTISVALTAQNPATFSPEMAAIRKTARLIYEDIKN